MSKVLNNFSHKRREMLYNGASLLCCKRQHLQVLSSCKSVCVTMATDGPGDTYCKRDCYWGRLIFFLCIWRDVDTARKFGKCPSSKMGLVWVGAKWWIRAARRERGLITPQIKAFGLGSHHKDLVLSWILSGQNSPVLFLQWKGVIYCTILLWLMWTKHGDLSIQH